MTNKGILDTLDRMAAHSFRQAKWHPQPPPPKKCPTCGKPFSSPLQYRIHIMAYQAAGTVCKYRG